MVLHHIIRKIMVVGTSLLVLASIELRAMHITHASTLASEYNSKIMQKARIQMAEAQYNHAHYVHMHIPKNHLHAKTYLAKWCLQNQKNYYHNNALFRNGYNDGAKMTMSNPILVPQTKSDMINQRLYNVGWVSGLANVISNDNNHGKAIRTTDNVDSIYHRALTTFNQGNQFMKSQPSQYAPKNRTVMLLNNAHNFSSSSWIRV